MTFGRLLKFSGSVSSTADQSVAVCLQYLEDWWLAEIADHMDRSRDATIGLLKRGLKNLKKQLNTE